MDEQCSSTKTPPQCPTINFLVPRHLVKLVKSALECHGQLSRLNKIKPAEPSSQSDEERLFLIPTKFSYNEVQPTAATDNQVLEDQGIFSLLGISDYSTSIEICSNYSNDVEYSEVISGTSRTKSYPTRTQHDNLQNRLTQTINRWISSLPKEVMNSIRSRDASAGEPKIPQFRNINYMVYPPLLLLSPELYKTLPPLHLDLKYEAHKQRLFQMICSVMHVTHVALNGPISQDFRVSHGSRDVGSTAPNIFRSPTAFTPLYGDFGPELPLSHRPNREDFDQAFWCSSRQNGIQQIWAPRYTMFSRGNISEKSRILRLETLKPSILSSVTEETSAVDLYAGIGYFTFSYAKAGVAKVLCWELNPWSMNGLRKGANANGWSINSLGEGEDSVDTSKIIVFEESNQYASERIQLLRCRIPPIRHVNCGYLPSSKESWKTAVKTLDPELGGCIHAHENVARSSIDTRAKEILNIFEQYEQDLHGAGSSGRSVTCEHVEQVKSYAPGVIHCVFDIAITPVNASNASP